MFSSKIISTLVVGFSLLECALSSPQPATYTRGPSVPSGCPLSTTTTFITSPHSPTPIEDVDIFPACPTVTTTIGRIPVPCPKPTTTERCFCPFQPATSTVTYGCVGKCCPSQTPTVTRFPNFNCPRGCAAVCPTTAATTRTVTKSC